MCGDSTFHEALLLAVAVAGGAKSLDVDEPGYTNARRRRHLHGFILL
jgi:hypothetical protein